MNCGMTEEQLAKLNEILAAWSDEDMLIQACMMPEGNMLVTFIFSDGVRQTEEYDVCGKMIVR